MNQSVEIAYINPWPVWGIENEDDDGSPLPGLWLELIEVTDPRDGTLWVTSITTRMVMLRKDVLDLSTVDENQWGFPHKPSHWNNLEKLPCAVPTQAKFLPGVVAPLLPLGVTVLPLGRDEQIRPMAHAIMRGEDWIGYVMSSLQPSAQPLPAALQMRLSPGPVQP